MRIILFVSVLFFTSFAFSENLQKAQLRFSALSYEQRFESGTDPQLEAKTPQSFALGIRFDRHISSLEYSRFTESTGNQTFRTERKFQDILAWYKYALFIKKNFRGVLGASLGTYQEEVTTYFYDIKRESASGSKWSAGTLLGAEIDIFDFLIISLEGRLIAGQNLDPNPNPSLLARLSFQF